MLMSPSRQNNVWELVEVLLIMLRPPRFPRPHPGASRSGDATTGAPVTDVSGESPRTIGPWGAGGGDTTR